MTAASFDQIQTEGVNQLWELKKVPGDSKEKRIEELEASLASAIRGVARGAIVVCVWNIGV